MDKNICPLCGNDNNCNSGGDICWCHNTEIPEGILSKVPDSKRGNACICLNCIEEYKREEKEKRISEKFREMLKGNMHIDRERIKDIISNTEYGILSTIGPGGYPYGVPMSHIVMGEDIYFHCGLEGHKIDNLNYSNKVSYTIVGKTKLVPELQDTDYESVIVFGEAKLVGGKEKTLALKKIVDKYAWDFKEEGYESIGPEFDIVRVYKIEVEHITGKERKDGKR